MRGNPYRRKKFPGWGSCCTCVNRGREYSGGERRCQRGLCALVPCATLPVLVAMNVNLEVVRMISLLRKKRNCNSLSERGMHLPQKPIQPIARLPILAELFPVHLQSSLCPISDQFLHSVFSEVPRVVAILSYQLKWIDTSCH